MIKFIKADASQTDELSELADEIWHQHFVDIISEGQIDYMLEKFQSSSVMKEQMKHGYEYYFFCINGKNEGYFALQQQEDNTLFLSKIYLRKEFRGNGYSRKAFEFIENIVSERKLKKVWLTVNINNEIAIRAYKAFGMYVGRTQKSDIGNGYFMDDYVFEKDYK